MPAQRVTYTGAIAGDYDVNETHQGVPAHEAAWGSSVGFGSTLGGGSTTIGGGRSVVSAQDGMGATGASSRPVSAFSRMQREGGEGGLDTTQLREAGMSDAVGRLREGNE